MFHMDDLPTLTARLHSLRPGLKPGHARVVDLVIAEPQFALNATAADIASRAGVSTATVVRAARSAGFGGLAELKRALVSALGAGGGITAPKALSEARTVKELTNVIIASHAESLKAAHGTLDAAALEAAVQALDGADRILITASGTSQPVAHAAAYRLTLSGLTVQHSEDSYSSVLLAGLLSTADALIAVSHSGETRQTLDVVEQAQSVGATVIAITSYSQSTLAGTADIPLVAIGSAGAEHLVESSSRIAHLAVVDVLHSALALNIVPKGSEQP